MEVFYLINEIGLQLMVLIVALLSFSRLDKFTKVLCLQVVISVVVYIATKLFDNYYNPLIYNIYIPFEAFILLYVAISFVNLKYTKFLFYIFLACILLVFCLQVIFNGVYNFFNYTYCVSSFFITVTYLYLIFVRISETKRGPNFKSFIITSLGIIIYFACNTPYMGLMYYLLDVYDSEFNNTLFTFITRVLSNVRYLFFLVGIILMVRSNKLSHLNISS